MGDNSEYIHNSMINDDDFDLFVIPNKIKFIRYIKTSYLIYLIIKVMFENQNLIDDEDFMELALLISFPRKRKMFLERLHNFTKWRDDRFFNRFLLFKHSVYFILDYTIPSSKIGCSF